MFMEDLVVNSSYIKRKISLACKFSVILFASRSLSKSFHDENHTWWCEATNAGTQMNCQVQHSKDAWIEFAGRHLKRLIQTLCLLNKFFQTVTFATWHPNVLLVTQYSAVSKIDREKSDS